MKKNDIISHLIDKKEKSDVTIVPLFINCIVSIFSLCLSVDFFCFFHVLIKDSFLEKFLIVIMLGLAFTFVAALRFSFFSFVKSLAEKYNLLLILGIKTKDFWLLAVKEYFLKVFLLGVKVIMISNAVCIAITYYVFHDHFNVSFIMVIKQFLLTVIMVFILYLTILIITMFAIIYNRKNKSLIDFFEQFSRDFSKSYKHKNGYLRQPVLGIVLLIISFILLINFRVEKMILAVFINVFGAYLLIHSDGYLIKKIIKKNQNKYYKKILIWTDLIFQYNINSYLIFIIYTLNFFLVYIMGGLIVSIDSEQDFNVKYPYETVIYSDSRISSHNSYDVFLVGMKGFGSVTAISNQDYNDLMKSNDILSRGEVLFLNARAQEDRLPLAEKEIQIGGVGQVGNDMNYDVKDAQWQVVFGQNVFPELNWVIVFNDNDFAQLSKNKLGTEKYLFLSMQAVDSDKDSFQLKDGAKYWNRTEQVAKERMENKVVVALIYIISLILILEGQAFIFTKQIVNLKEESYRYDILKQLGIKNVDLKEIIEKKIKGILMMPSILAIISGLMFFGMDFCQNSSGFTLLLLLRYGIVILIFALIQISGCYFISRKIKKIYMNGY